MISSLLGKVAVGLFGAMMAGGGDHPFSWFQLVTPSWLAESLHLHQAAEAFFIPTAWGLVIAILLAAVLARMGLEKVKAQPTARKYVPDAGLTPRNLFEVVIEWLWGLAENLLGPKEAKAFFPLIATLFIYVLASNLSGFIPGTLPVTENISHNFAMAICVFLVFNYAGFSRNGFGYVKHLAGPILALAPAFFVLETISLLIRPISLSVRLTVNITVDHLLQQISRDLGGSFLAVVGEALLPVPLYFLGLLVAVVQAFVFALLTTIYVSLSVAHEDHGDGHPAH